MYVFVGINSDAYFMFMFTKYIHGIMFPMLYLNCIAFLFFGSSSFDTTINVWDVEQGSPIYSLSRHR